MAYPRFAFLLLVLNCLAGCASQIWSGSPFPALSSQDSPPPDAAALTAAAETATAQRPQNAPQPLDDQLKSLWETNPAEFDAIVEQIRGDQALTPEVAQIAQQQFAALQNSAPQNSAPEPAPIEPAAALPAAPEPDVPSPSVPPAAESTLALDRSLRRAASPERQLQREFPAAATLPPQQLPRQTPAPIRPVLVPAEVVESAAAPANSQPPDVVSGQEHSSETPAAAEPTPEAPTLRDWREELTTVIRALESQVAEEPDQTEAARQDAFLRLLYIMADRRDDAVDPIPAMRDDDREFFKHLTFSLMTWLDTEGRHVSSRKAALALRELRTAANYLANQSTLDVRNLALCREVSSYGDYKEFVPATFRGGDEVVLYVEIENFTSTAVGKDFQTEFQYEYEIFDKGGRRVTFEALPLDKQSCENRRRDYFVAYRIFLPLDIPAGEYSLVLTAEDVQGRKSNQASVEFKIR